MPEHLLHGAGEDVAQIVQCGGGDISVVLQGVQGTAAEMILLDQRVGGDPLAPRKRTLNAPEISGIMFSELPTSHLAKGVRLLPRRENPPGCQFCAPSRAAAFT